MMARLLASAALLCALPAGAQDLSTSQIERGRYIAITGNCVGCHTDVYNDGTPWAGGREMATPFGTLITPNLTSDDDTGIGLYTREEFYRAMHEGIRRDGAQLYPAFPYAYFTLMPREDVDALYDYLRTIPPIQSDVVSEEEMPLPLQFRTAIMGWKLLHFDQGEFVPDPTQSEEWNHGRYLVDGPGHCGACHTGKTLTGGDDQDEYLRGGVLENWLAPNIRGGANGGIAHWSEEEIVTFLQSGRNAHTGAMTRMGEVVQLSTQYMLEEDLAAIAVYLKSLEDDPRPQGGPPQDRMARGEGIYFDNCAACHQTSGEGVPHIFARLDGSNKVLSEDPTTVIRIILEGAQAVPTDRWPGPLGMPAYHWKLDDEQVADVVTYLRNAWGNSAPEVSAGDVADLREDLSPDWPANPQ